MSRLRQLILLRHAHAEASVGADIERTLSVLGEAEADAAGDYLAALPGLGAVDRVVCSNAQRTRQTATRVLERMGYVDTRIDARIYEASPGDLLAVLDEHTEVETLMLVGHNPGLEQLVALLCSGRSGAFRGMPPAAVAVIRLPDTEVIEPGCAELSAFWSP